MKRKFVALLMITTLLIPHVKAVDKTQIIPDYVYYFEETGAMYHVSPDLLKAVIDAESSGYEE